MVPTIHIVFDGPPGPESGRFVEVETPYGSSISVGEWKPRPDGYWALVLTPDDFPTEEDMAEEARENGQFGVGA
jgi:hypothetical protein